MKKRDRDRGRRLFWQALAAGAVMILLGICLAKDHSLKHPVFLTMNREILAYPFGEETHPLWAYRPFRVYYVQDRWTKKRVRAVEFPELEGFGTYRQLDGGQKAYSLFSDTSTMWDGSFYQFFEIPGEIFVRAEAMPREGLTIRKARVIYEDGTEETVDLGTIRILPASETDFFHSTGAMASSDGVEEYTYQADRDCRVLGIAVPPKQESALRERFQIQVNGQDVWKLAPFWVREGDMLRIRIRQNKEWDRDFAPYEAVFGLEGEAGGQKEQLLEQALSGDLTWTGNSWQVWEYLEERGIR